VGGTDDVSVAAGGGVDVEVDVEVDWGAGGVPQPARAPSKISAKIISRKSLR